MMKKIFLIILLVSFSAAAQAAPVTHNAKQPIEIDADALEVMQKQQKAIFSGNVVAKQGDMRLKASTMTVHYKPGGGDNAIEKIEVDGNVVLTTKSETVKGNRGVYNMASETVMLFGDVVLTRDQNILKGSKLIFNIATGKSKILKDETGRVRGLFIPQ